MHAIVLVGGEGTRLRPLSWRTPKQLVPILNRPLLEHLLSYLLSHGVQRVTLAMTRRSEEIRNTFGNGSALGIDLDYAYEKTPLGSGGAIANAARNWDVENTPSDEPFLVLNGDILTDLDISMMLIAHQAHSAKISIGLVQVDDPSPFGVTVLEDSTTNVVPRGPTRIKHFVEKPSREMAPSRWINAGVWIFDHTLLDDMDPNRFHQVEHELFPTLAQDGHALLGVPHEGYWVDVGTSHDYLRANLHLVSVDTTSSANAIIEASAEVTKPVLVGAGTTIAAEACVGPRAVVGNHCHIETGARVVDSVLWDNVTVGSGAIIENSVLATGTVVGTGAVLDGAIVAHGAQVVPDTSVPRGHMIEPGVIFDGKT